MTCCKNKNTNYCCGSSLEIDPIDQAAFYVVDNTQIHENNKLDPYTISIIINIIIEIVKLAIYYYNNKEKAVKAMKLNWIKKWIIWKAVCKFCVNKDTKELDKDLALDIYGGICKMIESFTDEQKAKLFISSYLK